MGTWMKPHVRYGDTAIIFAHRLDKEPTPEPNIHKMVSTKWVKFEFWVNRP